MTNFDVLIIGGGVAGMQCALVLGSAQHKPYASNKQVGIIMHQKASHLQNALFNNALGIPPGTLGSDLLNKSKEHLTNTYPGIFQISNEKALEITPRDSGYQITTNKQTYWSKTIVVALNYSKPLTLKGLENYVIPHTKTAPKKDRIQLKNSKFLVSEGFYTCGTIAGLRSQFAIAAGSGATVATDILTVWNDGNHTKIHDKP